MRVNTVKEESMKVVACLGETFIKFNGAYYSDSGNALFLQKVFGIDNVIIFSAATQNENAQIDISGMTSVIDAANFVEAPVPENCTTKIFYKKSFLNFGFYTRFAKSCDSLIEANPDAIFWARTPSPLGISFSNRVLRKKKKLLHHVCGDARLTWKDQKYSGLNKCLAFVFSFVVTQQTLKISKNTNAYNLTSGSLLFEYINKVANGRTSQFVDIALERYTAIPTSENKVLLNQKKLVLFVGRIVKDKGVFELIEAIKSFDDFKVRIVGDGPDLKDAIALVEKNNIQHKVEFTGAINNKDLKKHYLDAYVVTMLSKTNEGFPRVIMEAWNYHKPVMSTSVGGVSAFIQNGVNAVVIRPGSISDIINGLKYINDTNNYSKLIEGSKQMSVFSNIDYWRNFLQGIIKKIAG